MRLGLRRNPLAQRSHRLLHLLFGALGLALVFVILRGLGQVLAPVAAALMLSYLLDPIVEWMNRRLRLSRTTACVVLFLVALLAVAAVFVIAVPLMVRELRIFAEAVPGYVRQLREVVVPWVERTFSVKVPTDLAMLSDQFGADTKAVVSKALRPLGGVAGDVARGTAGVLSWLAALLLVPVFTFYFLPNFPAIVRGAGELIPRRYYPVVRDTVVEIDRALAAWIRGQLTVVALLALLYSIGLSIVGIKMSVLIGTITGLLAFIPYVGVSVGVVVSLLVCLLEYSGPGQLIGVAVVFGVIQALEGLVLTPYLVGEKVGLGTVGVLLALMIGGNIFGFVGVLLAVPTAAALVVVLRRAVAAYRSSGLYRDGARDALPEPGVGSAAPEPATDEKQASSR